MASSNTNPPSSPPSPAQPRHPGVSVYNAPTLTPYTPPPTPNPAPATPTSPPAGGAYAVAGEKPPTSPKTSPKPAAPKPAAPAESDTARDEDGPPFVAALKARLDRVKTLAGELVEYGTHYGLARLDRVAFTVRRVAIFAVLGLAAGIVGLSALIYATVLLLSGLADGLGILLGHRPWLGALLTGVIVLAATALTAYLLVSSLLGKGKKELQDKYAARKAAQRQRFGRDVDSAASQPASHPKP